MFLAQVVNGLLLPIILVFVMLLSRRRGLLRELTSGAPFHRRLVRHDRCQRDVDRACYHLSAAVTAPAILHLSLVTSGERTDAEGRKLGRIGDLVLRLGEGDYPPISGAVVKVAGRLVFVPAAEQIRWLAASVAR
jgi:hypothetical protein